MGEHISETVSAGQLRAFIERIERLEEEIKSLNADKSEVYAEMRGVGFDVKAVRQCVAARKLDSAEREERNAIFDLYWEALTGSSRVHVHEGRELVGKSHELGTTPKASNPKASSAEKADLGTAPSELTDTQEQPETANAIHERPSINAEAYPEAGPQAEASPAGIGTGTLAGHEGRSEGEAASADLPTNSPSPANAPRLAADDEAAQANPTSSATHSNPQPAASLGNADEAEADSSPASAVLSEKKDCLKLRNGHCKISFETSALCSECNRAKAEKARAA